MRGLWIAVLIGLSACSADNIKKRYILAEKLWGSKQYQSAVDEFQRVALRDPRGKLGMQALYRAAMTETLFLGQHKDAIKKFRAYIEASSEGTESWSAQLQIGDILFEKLNAYDEAILHYRALLQKKPSIDEASEFLFRIGRSHFFLWEFQEAVQQYKELTQKYPTSKWAERAWYEIAVSLYTSGEQQPDDRGPGMDAYRKAIAAYEDFMKRYPKSIWVPEAKFGIANCLEELDQLDVAYEKYLELRTTYPSPRIIAIKLTRLKERQDERRR